MAANEKARPVAADQGQELKHDEILSQKEASVNTANWLKDFRASHPKLQGTEIVEAVRILFPGFDKTLLSKCMNPEKYGIQLSQEVMERLKSTFEKTEGDGTNGPA